MSEGNEYQAVSPLTDEQLEAVPPFTWTQEVRGIADALRVEPSFEGLVRLWRHHPLSWSRSNRARNALFEAYIGDLLRQMMDKGDGKRDRKKDGQSDRITLSRPDLSVTTDDGLEFVLKNPKTVDRPADLSVFVWNSVTGETLKEYDQWFILHKGDRKILVACEDKVATSRLATRRSNVRDRSLPLNLDGFISDEYLEKYTFFLQRYIDAYNLSHPKSQIDGYACIFVTTSNAENVLRKRRPASVQRFENVWGGILVGTVPLVDFSRLARRVMRAVRQENQKAPSI